jgi:hypothetical protein
MIAFKTESGSDFEPHAGPLLAAEVIKFRRAGGIRSFKRTGAR